MTVSSWLAALGVAVAGAGAITCDPLALGALSLVVAVWVGCWSARSLSGVCPAPAAAVLAPAPWPDPRDASTRTTGRDTTYRLSVIRT